MRACKTRGDWLIIPAVQMRFYSRKAVAKRRKSSQSQGDKNSAECFRVSSPQVLHALEQKVDKDRGDILVTGASGGVGSIAIAILSGWGYRVVASTGKLAEADYLRSLGAADVIDRAALSAPGKPIQKERWAGVIDSVGSHTLVNAGAQTCYGGTVTACGLAHGMDFSASVAPFILRGVKLIGIDSVMAPLHKRVVAWDRLAHQLDARKLETITQEISLAAALVKAPDILVGQVRGRLVVNVNT